MASIAIFFVALRNSRDFSGGLWVYAPLPDVKSSGNPNSDQPALSLFAIDIFTDSEDF